VHYAVDHCLQHSCSLNSIVWEKFANFNEFYNGNERIRSVIKAPVPSFGHVALPLPSLADPGLSFGGPGRAPKTRVSRGVVWGGGYAPSPENVLIFLPRNDAFCVHSDT